MRPSERNFDCWAWRWRRAFILWRDGYRCGLCGSEGEPGNPLQCGHVIAVARGSFGAAHEWLLRNMFCVCRRCNREQGVEFVDGRPWWVRWLWPLKDVPSGKFYRTSRRGY